MVSIELNQIFNLLWYLSIAGGLCVLVLCAERVGLDGREAFFAGLFGALGAILGGSLMESNGLPPGVSVNPLTWSQFVYADKGVFTSAVGGAFLSTLWLFVRRQSVLRFADVAALACAFAYVVARLDCFAHGHCFGIPTDVPWAVTFGSGSQAFIAQTATGMIAPGATATLPVHPTQIYHAVAGIVLFVFLSRWRRTWHGSRFALALAGYGVIRFFLQFFRGDSVPVIAGLDEAQIFSILFIGAGSLLWFIRGRKQLTVNLASDAPASRGTSVENVQ